MVFFHLDALGELDEISRSHCDQFSVYLADKRDRIRMDLVSGFQIQRLDTPDNFPGLILWDEFQIIMPEDVERSDGSVWPTTSSLAHND